MFELRKSLGAAVLFSLATQYGSIAVAHPQGYLPTSKYAELSLRVAQLGEMVVFVAPDGTDAPGSGSQAQPFRSITAAIRSNPQTGITIQVAQGNYSAETGEVFPISLPPGTKLRGSDSSKGQGVLLKGGGKFISPTFASQNIALIATNNTLISGITLTNSNPRGYALWVESGKNVTIANNTFADTTHDGVFLTGSANALITNNLFTRNRGSGISAVGTSTGEIRDNVFDNTGFGLSIGQRSQVILTGNGIVNNVDGVIISNFAAPTLRKNTITNNSRYGLVVLKDRNGQPTPNLGTASSPGRNVFKLNKDKDISNISGVAIAAAGNEFNSSRTTGPIDTVAANVPSPPNLSEPPSLPPPIVPAIVPTVPPAQPPIAISPATQPKPRPTAIPPLVQPSPIPKAIPPVTTKAPAPTVPASLPRRTPPSTILIEREPSSTSSNVAINSPTNQPIRQSPLPKPASSSVRAAAFRYRVVVPMISATTREQVRRVVPDAFSTKSNGQSVVQAGAYITKEEANKQLQKLAQSGLKARIDEIR